MPRARNIKPAFFTNEYLAELSFEARLLFVGLWTLADRCGRLEDRPKGIKGKIFPYDNLDVDVLLQELSDSPEVFIIRYEVDGKRYIQVANFEKHQHPHIKEAESTIPAPCLYSADTVQEQDAHNTSPSDSLLLIPDSLNLITDSSLPCSASTELSGAETAPDPQEPPIISIQLNDGTNYPIYQTEINKWAALYPSVDIAGELRKMVGWADANPKKRKTKSGIKRFINAWLAREQDKGGGLRGEPQQGKVWKSLD